MPGALQELLAVTSPVLADVDTDSTDSRHLVKGFVSVEKLDRSKDLVSPEEFNIAQFMAAPVLMVNHKFWIDRSGNETSVGKPVSLNIAKLAKHPTDDSIWNVVDVRTKDVISTFSRVKVPNLKKGDRGLFVVAEVTEDSIWEEVKQGKLAAFSWRGLVQVDFKATTEGVQRVLKNIDLFEISLVHVPDNPNSTFELGKSFDVDDENVYVLAHVHLSKSRFENEGQATKWLEDHDLSNTTLIDKGTDFVARQNAGGFDPKTFIRAKMSEGVVFVCGHLNDDQQIIKHWITEVVGEEEVKSLASMWEKDSNESSVEKEEKMSTVIEEKTEVKDEEKKTTESTEKTTEKTDAEKASEVLATQVASSVTDTLKPVLESVTDSLKGVVEAMGSIAKSLTIEKTSEEKEKKTDTEETKEPEEKATETEKETEKKTEEKTEEMTGDLAEVQKMLGQLGQGLLALDKKVTVVAKSAPSETVREEKIETQKSTEKGDKNAIFDAVWPFLGKS